MAERTKIENVDYNVWEAGNEKIFRSLFKEYYPQLFLYGFKIVQQKELLEDTIQELFTELWQRKQLPEVKSVKAYLIKAFQYKLFKKLQQQKINTRAETTSEMPFEITRETLIIQAEEDNEKAAKVERFLSTLSNRQREIIYLRFYRNFSYEEISEVMDINYQASRNLLSQAIKILRQLEVPVLLLLALLLNN